MISEKTSFLPSLFRPIFIGRMLKLGSSFCYGSTDWDSKVLFVGPIFCWLLFLFYRPRLLPSSFLTASFNVISLRIISAITGNLFLRARLIAASWCASAASDFLSSLSLGLLLYLWLFILVAPFSFYLLSYL